MKLLSQSSFLKNKNTTQLWIDRSKVQCCREQYYIGTWNVRYMNQGKLEVVKQEMAKVIVNILGISELKWTGMGDNYIYCCGQEPLEEME